MKLHVIKHDLKTVLWCGPGALATVSGLPTSIVMQALREVSGRKTIKGVSPYALKQAAIRLGYSLLDVVSLKPGLKAKTLARWTFDNRTLLAESAVIFNVSNHYVVVSGRKFNDNWTKTPVALKKAPRRRARVRGAWRIVPLTVRPPLPVVPIKATNPSRQKAQRLARQHGISVESDEPRMDSIWVYPPPSLEDEEKDRYAGDHVCYDWSEVLKRVEHYVTDLESVKSPASVTS